MIAAGVRVFAGGLESAARANSLRAQANGEVVVTDGPYLEAKQQVGGFCLLEAANMDEALAWGARPRLSAGRRLRCVSSAEVAGDSRQFSDTCYCRANP
jgi:hypothetical protein